MVLSLFGRLCHYALNNPLFLEHALTYTLIKLGTMNVNLYVVRMTSVVAIETTPRVRCIWMHIMCILCVKLSLEIIIL